ncbi:MAG: hypothetical protein IAE80_06180 [Anaerolinea sp.]|nr:hypothetical protein [Anaerolinea sp.]
MVQKFVLESSETLYNALKPLLFRLTAGEAHARVLRLLALADSSALACALLRWVYRVAFAPHSRPSPEFGGVHVGGVTLDHPLILAAGFVKGHGFTSEAQALAAVERGEDIIPGWRSIPALVGLVEFGSFTRYPRMGNPGVVMWRDPATRSIQNRVGLKNPGARAAAAFLARHKRHLPRTFGINIAVSPGVSDPAQEETEIREAIRLFLDMGIVPSWFTLNLSCPNTEDDPGANQTEASARRLCAAAISELNGRTPLWVKLSPGLADEQYAALLRAAVETGVQAIIATNTLAQPTPDNPLVLGGVAGGRLYASACEAVTSLLRAKLHERYKIDVIACGGIADGRSWASFGATAGQYYSALIYRGALAAAIIEREYEQFSRVDTR